MADDKKKPEIKKIHSGRQEPLHSGYTQDSRPTPLIVSRDRPAPTEKPKHGKPDTED